MKIPVLPQGKVARKADHIASVHERREMGNIYIAVGGWSYEPWEESFYPPTTKKKDQLRYAASKLTSIEINSTYYRSQTPSTFANWAAATPDDFRFPLKASRFATNRRILAEAGESVAKVLAQGFTELGNKLGPIVWQFAGTKPFDESDMAAFIKLLPSRVDEVPVRHAFEVRHPSFADAAFERLMRDAGFAVVLAEDSEHPRIDMDTADFRYARIMGTNADEPSGYSAADLDGIADKVRGWAAKGDAFVYFISGAKERNPAAAIALIERVR